LWLTSDPLASGDARAALAAVVPDLADRESRGQVEIVDLEEWYHRAGPIDAVDAWVKRAELALEHGYAGLRLSCNTFEHIASDPPIGTGFEGQRVVGLFSYSLEHVSAADVLDIAGRYQFVIGRRRSDDAAGAETVRLQRRSDEDLRTEINLREADRRKNEFLGMLGHELRNPLASILTASQLMTLRGGDREFHKELEIIQRQVSHVTSMVDEVLDVSRIIAGRVQLNCERVEIADAVHRGVERATPLIAKRGHRLHLNCPAHGLTVYADPARIAQVLASLLSNAARFTEPGGDITVSAERGADQVSVSVSDTGRGIEPERLPGIFEPFGKNRETRRRGESGLGLGLCIVRNLVELHRGTVDAASTVGKGSRFVVRLPAVQESASA
jgi:signal transduction histidine kinase